MIKFVPLAVVLLAVVASGTMYHAKMTDRFAPADSELLRKFTDRVPRLPLSVGDWRGEEEKIPDKEFDLTNCTAYVSRRYINPSAERVVSVYVVSGSARHITIHSPDWCYQGAGYKMDGQPQQFETEFETPAGSESAQFLTASFRKPNLGTGEEEVLRIFWTFSDNGEWEGPRHWGGPKAYYAGRPAMYKIYLICPVAPGGDDSADGSPVASITADLFPKFNEILFTDTTDVADADAAPSVESDLIAD